MHLGQTRGWPVDGAGKLIYNCLLHGGPISWLDLTESGLTDFALLQLRDCPSEVQFRQVDPLRAALKLASLLPATQPAAVNDAVANTVRIVTGMDSDLDSRRGRDSDVVYNRAHPVWKEAFGTLAALFATSGHTIAEAANRAGASKPEFKAVAERTEGGAVVLKHLHDAAVAAADAAMAALVMEDESERSAAAKPRKSKKKSKPQANASAAPEPASPAVVAAASPASAPPAAAPLPALPPAAAAAAALLPAATVPPPPAAAATPPPLPAYLTAARVAAAASRAPPAPPPAAPPAAPLPPPPAPSQPSQPSPAAPAGATKECCVCLDDVAAADLHLLFPCGHRCVCEACAAAVMAADPAMRRCPKCRAAVVGAARVYEE
jgi:hypothetical protein